jgi:hypothetical protein
MSKQFLRFNINSLVNVKLTEEGRSILGQRYSALSSFYGGDFPDENGYSTFQFNHLAEEFGDKLTIGNPNPPFEPDMMVEIEIGE